MSQVIRAIRGENPTQVYRLSPSADTRYREKSLQLVFDAFLNLAFIFSFTNPLYKLIHLGVAILCFERLYRLQTEVDHNFDNPQNISIHEYEKTLLSYTFSNFINFSRFIHCFLVSPNIYNIIFTIGYVFFSYTNFMEFVSFSPDNMRLVVTPSFVTQGPRISQNTTRLANRSVSVASTT